MVPSVRPSVCQPVHSLCKYGNTWLSALYESFPPSGEIYHLPDHEGPQVYSFCRHHTQVLISSIGLVIISPSLAQRLEALQHGNQRRLRLENSGLWSSTPYRCRDDWVTKKMTKIIESQYCDGSGKEPCVLFKDWMVLLILWEFNVLQVCCNPLVPSTRNYVELDALQTDRYPFHIFCPQPNQTLLIAFQFSRQVFIMLLPIAYYK